MDLWGYTVDDLQDEVAFTGNNVTGTLHYISDYSSAFGPDLDHGNYLAVHADVDASEAGSTPYTITVKVTNPVELDSDRVAVIRIADKNSQTLTVVASAEGYTSVTKAFRLNNLVCEAS